MKNRLKSKIYAGLAATALLTSCGEPTAPKTEPPPVNHPPVAALSISPRSGIAPLADTISYSCSDQDNDLESSTFSRDGNTISTSPSLDTVIDLTQSASFGLICKDQQGNVASRGPIDVTVSQPLQSVSQTATLSDSVDIRYNAALTNLASAERKEYLDGNLVKTDTITGPTYSETIQGARKGTWRFISGSDTASVVVPDYDPVLDTAGVNIEMDEGDSTGTNLTSRLHDANPEDNPHITSASSTDGKTQVDVIGDSLALKALGQDTGQYSIRVDVSSGNQVKSFSLGGKIYDRPTISGQFQNSETWTGSQGTMRFYTVAGSDTILVPTDVSDPEGNNVTNGDGNFSFRLRERSDSLNLEKLLLMARQGVPGNYLGYVRTREIPAKDTSILVRGVPYPDFTSPDNFIQFMQLLGTQQTFDFDGIYLPGFGGYKRVSVLSSFRGAYSPAQQDSIADIVMDPNGINAAVGNKISRSSIILGDQEHYSINEYGDIIPDSGTIVIAPDSTLISKYGYTGLTVPFSRGTLEWGAVIYTLPGAVVSRRVLSRELGHVSLGVGEPPILPDLTIMNVASTLYNFGPLDIKAGKLEYNPTFKISNGIVLPYIDDLSNILRTDFKQ